MFKFHGFNGRIFGLRRFAFTGENSFAAEEFAKAIIGFGFSYLPISLMYNILLLRCTSFDKFTVKSLPCPLVTPFLFPHQLLLLYPLYYAIGGAGVPFSQPCSPFPFHSYIVFYVLYDTSMW